MNNVLIYLPIAAPLLCAILVVIFGWSVFLGWCQVLSSALTLVCGVLLQARFANGHSDFLSGLVRADALSAWMLIVIGSVSILATWASIGYLRFEFHNSHISRSKGRTYGSFLGLFISTMTIVVLANNLGVIWVAIEATTISTAFLVGFKGDSKAIEATWKYVIICSFGITLALLGVILLYFAALSAHIAPSQALNLSVLQHNAHSLSAPISRLALMALLLGFGTKAGLVPFHTWLPDAHGQAPPPISALMSGVLLSVAFSVLLRLKVISDLALGPNTFRQGLIILGILSIVVAGLLMVAQKDYKKLLAYSSIENMGLLCLGAASGSKLAIEAVLLQVLVHGIGKAVLFISAGQVSQFSHSTLVEKASGISKQSIILASCLGVGFIAIAGLPPFALFGTELTIIQGMLSARLLIPVIIAVIFLVIAFGSFSQVGIQLLFGAPIEQVQKWVISLDVVFPLLIGVLAMVAIGLFGGELMPLLSHSAKVLATS